MTRQTLPSDFIKRIKVKTCEGIYDELRKSEPEFYCDAPSEGVELEVDYVDTWKEGKQFDKAIVAIHGVPGYYDHFNQLIHHYLDTSVRVIVPNLPDFSHTRETNAFWHSTKEKVQFLRDFLVNLKIKTIDCLISHSFGIQTNAALWENPGDIEIKSVALFSPQPLFDLTKDVVRRTKRIFKFKSELWYNFLSIMRFYKLPFTPMRIENINEFLMLCSSAIDYQTAIDIVHRLKKLVDSGRPVVLLYGENETLITKKSIAELHQCLEIDPEDKIIIDPENDCPVKLSMKKRIVSYSINGGGHFVHAKQHQFSNKMIDNLLDYHSN